MNALVELLEPYIVYILLGLVVFSFILLILLIVNMSKLKKVQKKYETFMTKEDVDLESLLTHYANKVNGIGDKHNELVKEISRLSNELKYCTQKIGVVRYNAIAGVGSDLSFAIAMLDAEDNGLVLNGIYSRDGSYVYSKPIQNGQSTYRLSEEEEEAIRLAKENNKVIG